MAICDILVPGYSSLNIRLCAFFPPWTVHKMNILSHIAKKYSSTRLSHVIGIIDICIFQDAQIFYV